MNLFEITVVECQDTWDDSDVVAFFTKRFEDEVKRDNENAFTNKWSNLFHYYTPEELAAASKAMSESADNLNMSERFGQFLKSMRKTK